VNQTSLAIVPQLGGVVPVVARVLSKLNVPSPAMGSAVRHSSEPWAKAPAPSAMSAAAVMN
jgi:hypothetical protein